MSINTYQQGKRAIVMGATSGIGMEVAKLLAAQGWQVGIAGRRKERMETLMRPNCGIKAYRQIDVTHPDAPQQLFALIEDLGGMDLYFHSSGIGWQNSILDIDKELKTVATNALGFTRMVTTAFNYFAEQTLVTNTTFPHFQIACISSIAGTKGLGAAPAYSATKRFQNHFLECLSQLAQIRQLPIHITDIRPGFVTTDLITGSHYPLQLSPEKVAKHIIKAIRGRKAVVIIDWKYRILVFFWRLIPRWLWVRLKIQ